ncbi:hypothetical protein HYH03_011906 [Edaphochlamys debaryana]|uniref:Uncharacterized protein n=1 Tax=Edaphochlamys debaryana TaxID=47281 RepID=A0A836BV31_9CHLO|nr:hypothetical protein HYH03_011906 [Edaphochlamys debaryana]|eukprot:KAG2489627.1 hypothetical protein HYH03_011906 [Edaphochlamys debaryana]
MGSMHVEYRLVFGFTNGTKTSGSGSLILRCDDSAYRRPQIYIELDYSVTLEPGQAFVLQQRNLSCMDQEWADVLRLAPSGTVSFLFIEEGAPEVLCASPPRQPRRPPDLQWPPSAPPTNYGPPLRARVVFRTWVPGMCVAAGERGGSGAPLQQRTCDGSAAQLFLPELSDDGAFRLKSASDPSLCWAPLGGAGSPTVGAVQLTPLVLAPCADGGREPGFIADRVSFSYDSNFVSGWTFKPALVGGSSGDRELCLGVQLHSPGSGGEAIPEEGAPLVVWSGSLLQRTVQEAASSIFDVIPAGLPADLIPECAYFDALSGIVLLRPDEGDQPPQDVPPWAPSDPPGPNDLEPPDGFFPPDDPAWPPTYGDAWEEPPTYGDPPDWSPPDLLDGPDSPPAPPLPGGLDDTSRYVLGWADSANPRQVLLTTDGCTFDTSTEGGYGSLSLDGHECFGYLEGNLTGWSTAPTAGFAIVMIIKLVYDEDGSASYVLASLSRTPYDRASDADSFTFVGGRRGSVYMSEYGAVRRTLTWSDREPVSVGADDLAIGADYREWDDYFKGSIAVALVYNRSLNIQQLNRIYRTYAHRFDWSPMSGAVLDYPPPNEEEEEDVPPPPPLAVPSSPSAVPHIPSPPPPPPAPEPDSPEPAPIPIAPTAPPTRPPYLPPSPPPGLPPSPSKPWCNGTGLVRGPFGTRPGGAPFNDSAASGGGRLPISRIAWSAGYSLAGIQMSYGIFAAPLRGGDAGFASGVNILEAGDRVVHARVAVGSHDGRSVFC